MRRAIMILSIIAALGVATFLVAQQKEEEKIPAQPKPNQQVLQPFQHLRQRLENFLKQAGLTEEDIAKVSETFQKRMETLKPVAEARRELFQTVYRETKANDQQIKQAIQRYREAVSNALKALAELDKQLDSSIHYSQKPKVEATLLMFNVIGQPIGGFAGRLLPSRQGKVPGATSGKKTDLQSPSKS